MKKAKVFVDGVLAASLGIKTPLHGLMYNAEAD
jgi:hypothetical protein